MKNIGFIGLGNMGRAMCSRLIEKGYHVTAYDIYKPSLDATVKKGAIAADSCKDVGMRSDIVFLMVLNYQQISSVAYGPQGVLSGMKKGSILVVNSTISYSDVKEVEKEAAKYGVAVVDAPVSGSKARAENGTLVFMTACKKEIFEEIKDILFSMGTDTTFVGEEVGNGQMIKAVNQLLQSIHTLAMSEGLVLASKAGVDPEILYKVILNAVGNSWIWENKAPQIIARDFATRGALDLNVKDLGICEQMGKDFKVPLYMTSLARELFATAQMRGLGKDDWCSVVKIYEEPAGIEVKAHVPHSAS